jgi:hypothetical protein
MKEIKVVGFNIPLENEDYIKLDSLSSLSEADIVVFNPSFSDTNYSTYTGSFIEGAGTYNGKPCYNHDSSTKVREHSIHWKKEIISYLNSGKTLFVCLSEKKSFYIQTGRQEFSGTGRNRQTTNIVEEFSNYNYLPQFDSIKFHVAHGKKIIANDVLFKTLLNRFSDFISYETYLTGDSDVRIGFTTKNQDKILGGVIKALGGNVVLLPKLDFDVKEFTKYNDKDEAFWTDDAIKVGKQFAQIILEIDSALNFSSNKTPRPDWVEQEQYVLPKSTSIRNKMEANSIKITELYNKNEVLNEELKKSEILNDLLFETGPLLENAVTYALKILGFEAENFDNGVLELDQVIVSPEGVRYIGECEGKDNKPIDISKFRQLSDALNEDFEREEVEKKAHGLLFGNPYRLFDPSKRKDPFTEKCISGAEREKIGLIETVELYKAAKYLSATKDEKYKKQCREVIYKGLGSIIKFPAAD